MSAKKIWIASKVQREPILVTEKAYEVCYKQKGFMPVRTAVPPPETVETHEIETLPETVETHEIELPKQGGQSFDLDEEGEAELPQAKPTKTKR